MKEKRKATIKLDAEEQALLESVENGEWETVKNIKEEMTKPSILSGIKPSGRAHIGNYLGLIKQAVELQNSGKYECLYCIVDFHSLAGSIGSGPG